MRTTTTTPAYAGHHIKIVFFFFYRPPTGYDYAFFFGGNWISNAELGEKSLRMSFVVILDTTPEHFYSRLPVLFMSSRYFDLTM